jgi:hypothetical protein
MQKHSGAAPSRGAGDELCLPNTPSRSIAGLTSTQRGAVKTNILRRSSYLHIRVGMAEVIIIAAYEGC